MILDVKGYYDKKEYKVTKINFETQEVELLSKGNPSIRVIKPLKDVIMAMCTGETDKDNEVLYEYDIIERRWLDKDGKEKYKRYVITYDTGSFICREKGSVCSSSVGYFATNVNKILKKIGNYFENPELWTEGE